MLVAAGALLFSYLQQAAADPIVTLADGTQLRGIVEGSVTRYLGIPFAKPPVGNLRWAPPQAWVNDNIDEVRDATQYASTCSQSLWGSHEEHWWGGDEDCLYLNVYVKNVEDAKLESPLPVGVFVHGGSYMRGAGSLPLYDGGDMVEYLDGTIIMVTTNYRLNVFGFLGSEELRSQDPEFGSTGNYGIQDQRMAFQWVQDNIASFGGDSSKVMIFGESAGAGSMANHLTMKKSWGTYSAVTLESGSFGPWITQSMSKAESVYEMVLEDTKCADLNCLLALSTGEVLRQGTTNFARSYAPTADGVEISTHPWIALANGDVNDVPVMHGSNNDEGSLFTTLPRDCTSEQLNKYWTLMGFSVREINEMYDLYVNGKTYPETPRATVYYWAAMRAWGDYEMSCPTKYASQQLSDLQRLRKRKSDTYLYHFEHTPRNANYTRHVSEIQYVFHQKELLGQEKDMAMADVMTTFWGNFIARNNPNSGVNSATGAGVQVNWPAYTTRGDQCMVMVEADDLSIVTGLKLDECDFMIDRIDNELREEFEA